MLVKCKYNLSLGVSTGDIRLYRHGKVWVYLKKSNDKYHVRYIYYGQAEEGQWFGFGLSTGRKMVKKSLIK